jgi:hypothetical protein
MAIDPTFQQAATGLSQPSDAIQQAIQHELSQANLLRIRGEIESAKSACLKILKGHPNAVEPHVLLGDINFEAAHYKNACEWYSLAHDLDPTNGAIQTKLAQSKLMLDKNVSSRPHSAGEKRSNWVIGFGAAGICAAIMAGAFIVGNNKENIKPGIANRVDSPRSESLNTPASTIVSAPASAPISMVKSVDPTESAVANTAPDTDPNPDTGVKKNETTKRPNGASADIEITRQILFATKFSNKLVNAMYDPRAKSLILTFQVDKGEAGRYIGACLADTALERDLKINSVTLRGVRDDVLAYMADVPREKILAVESQKGEVQGLADHDWINQVLTDEYFRGREVSGVGLGSAN